MTRFAIIGAGFTGLAAARDLAHAGHSVTLYEADAHVGGLAGSFCQNHSIGAEPLDRFYHHWFTSDREVMDLIDELGLGDAVTTEPSLTGVYFNKQTLRLSTPLDLLRFSALPLIDRVRLGLLALQVRRISDWRALENLTAAEWLQSMAGARVWQVIWEPLLKGKFGGYADRISAVWIWNKLRLRGGSRSKGGAEHLAYVRGSFATVAKAMAADILGHGGTIKTCSSVARISPAGTGGWLIDGPWGQDEAEKVITTVAPALYAKMIDHWAPEDAVTKLRRIPYLANLCLVLELDRSLGSTYWLNVTDPDFPFVGVIEHTRFQKSSQYGGRHIVYLSRYLPQEDPLLALSDDQVLAFALPHLQHMFPDFRDTWVQDHHVWKADWAQPIVELHYSKLIPPEDGPAPGLHLCSMAQVYPEDRGTNYAVRQGRRLAARLLTSG